MALSFLIKPASGLCQMRCEYCFYADEIAVRNESSFAIMDHDVTEKLVKASVSVPDRAVSFAFQGGEPTLAGLDYYRAFLEFVEKYYSSRKKVSYSIQTNGYDLDETWASFLADNRFMVGISLDGPHNIHDRYRKSASNEGTYERVMKAIGILEKYRIPFNVLAVITKQSAKHPEQIYRFFTENGLYYQQYIACLDPIRECRVSHSLSALQYGRFLCSIFDLWYQDLLKGKYVFIRYFDNLLGAVLGMPAEICTMNGRCGLYYVIEANGDVYPCDFYCLEEYKLGNIKYNTIPELDERRKQLHFIDQSAEMPKECRKCRWLNLCMGGCRRERLPVVGYAKTPDIFCEGIQQFFEYSYSRLKKAALILDREGFK